VKVVVWHHVVGGNLREERRCQGSAAEIAEPNQMMVEAVARKAVLHL
jgi:hypothetical protein